jgi:hypothetical protein
MRKTIAAFCLAVCGVLAAATPSAASDPTHVEYAYAYGQKYATATATCPDGYHVTGGGYGKWPNDAEITYNGPSWDGQGWTVSAENANKGGVGVDVQALCQYSG